MHDIDRGRIFRQAWIAGVTEHYPGEPKPGYVATWEDTPEWEKASAIAVHKQIAAFIETTDGATSKLSREQRARFVALCWIGQIHKHIPDPKPSYVADWEQLPHWQQQVDADIFDAVEASLATANQQ
ncbi:hypothetical protein OH799_21580 [Nocardia sp. NBC_00881]|uniref:hypothetical protein n=1 Tax=Nocardia sp. NBC_00881 TaxID=2975995 RepID=UPI00386C7B17|nr:hypothetical protein OH799_21580 [Nocardia sp. NBC_00881]